METFRNVMSSWLIVLFLLMLCLCDVSRGVLKSPTVKVDLFLLAVLSVFASCILIFLLSADYTVKIVTVP